MVLVQFTGGFCIEAIPAMAYGLTVGADILTAKGTKLLHDCRNKKKCYGQVIILSVLIGTLSNAPTVKE